MKDSTKKYWEKRSLLAEENKIKSVKALEKDISKLSDRYKSLLNKKILYWLNRFAKNEEMSIAEAKKYLTSEDIKELDADVWEYIRLGEGLRIDNSSLDYMKELSTKYHISRLDSVYNHIDACLSLFLAEEISLMTKVFDDIIKHSYYTVVYDMALGMKAEVNMFVPGGRKLAMILNEPWTNDGIEFSKRIWGEHRKRMSATLKKSLSDALIVGESPVKVADKVAKDFGVTKHHAKTILYTESAYMSEEARKEAFKDLGVEEYIIVATLDMKTSEICREMDGKVFRMEDRKVGVNAPPFHPNCRTTISPYYDYLHGTDTRAARNKEGKTIRIPDNMTYKDWYNKYVRTDPDYLLREEMYQNRHADKEQYERYREVLGKEAPKSFDIFQELKYNNHKEWDMMKGYYNVVNNGEISPLFGYNNFKKYHNSLEDKLIGLKTSDGIKIKGVSKHFTSRAIGTHDWSNPNNSRETKKKLNHSHVPTDYIDECIKRGYKKKEGTRSILYSIDGLCDVSINPNGTCIQCNRNRDKKVRE